MFIETFTVSGNLIFFTSDTPYAFTKLFGPDGTLLNSRPDVSVFQHDHFLFKWAFEYRGQFNDGAHFVFASKEVMVVGRMLGGQIQVVVDREVEVLRDEEGQPVSMVMFSRPAALTEVVLKKLQPPTLAVLLSLTAPDMMVLEPEVSIITCTYNRPTMLVECVDSVRSQSFTSWEHLIYDNGSIDPGVRRVLEATVRTDPRVRVYTREKNVDQPARFWNELLDRARGKYIGFLDDDNTKLPEFLATLVGVLDADETVDMVTCGCVIYDKEGNKTISDLNMKTTSAEIERRSTIDTGCFLIRREALERIGYFPLNIRTNEDWAMMRRAVAAGIEMVHLPEALATYRTHYGQRMEYCAHLGNEKDKLKVQESVWGSVYGVRVHHADYSRLTMSQKDVVAGAKAGLADISWIEEGSDLALILMPFQMEPDEIRAIASQYGSVVFVHSEDPFALGTNIARVRAAAEVCEDVWVCSNDTTCIPEYQEIVGDKYLVCSSLSLDHRVKVVQEPWKDRSSVQLVGYAYPGRVRFMREFASHFDMSKVDLIGDGWQEAGFMAEPTGTFAMTAEVYGQTRAVICLHRGHGDCVDGPHEPKLVQRGYVEGIGGARVFVDTSRPDHPFEGSEVEWFDSPKDLAEKLTVFLAKSDAEQEEAGRALRLRAARDFTYKTRMARIINAVRSPRYGAVIL